MFVYVVYMIVLLGNKHFNYWHYGNSCLLYKCCIYFYRMHQLREAIHIVTLHQNCRCNQWPFWTLKSTKTHYKTNGVKYLQHTDILSLTVKEKTDCVNHRLSLRATFSRIHLLFSKTAPNSKITPMQKVD